MSGSYATTPNFALKKPVTGADDDLWGTHWNQNADTLDATLQTHATGLTGAPFLPIAGGTMTGLLALSADPASALQAATKQYVDASVAGAAYPYLPLTGGALAGPGNLAINGTLNVTGATNATAGNFSGTLVTTGVNFFQAGNAIGTNNFIRLTPAAAGGTPSVSVLGPDANVNLLVGLPGTGAILSRRVFAGNGQTITWTNASTSLNSSPLIITAQISGTNNIVTGANFVLQATSDNFKQTNATPSIFTVSHSMLTGHSGGRNGISAYINQVGAGTSRADGVPALFYVGLNATTQASFNEGGTDAASDAYGAVFGAVAIARLNNGATNFGEVVGSEWDCAVHAGASVSRVTGVKSVMMSDHVVRGALLDDVAYLIGRQEGSSFAWDVGMQFSSPYGGWSYQSTASLITIGLAQDGSGGSLARGVDFRAPVFSSDAWSSPGAAITSGGAFRTGTGFLTGTATTTTLDATGSITTGSPAVVAGGTGWSASGNDVATDAFGGLYRVASVAGVATAITVVARPVVTGATPANPVALTARPPWMGVGLTVNLTWTAGTGVVVAGAAKGLGFYGTAPIAKQTGVAVTAAGIHAALTALGLIAP